MSGPTLHSVTGPPGTRLARWLDEGPQLHGSFTTVARSHRRIVVAASGEGATADDLPHGAATAEAVAARAASANRGPVWGRPREVSSIAELLRLARRQGRASVAVVRADPALLGSMTVGGWFDAGWKARLARRVLLRFGVPVLEAMFLSRHEAVWRSAHDAAFWGGVREAATDTEWRRWTASSFVGLCYHRLAGQAKPGQERMDLPPALLAAQLRLLRVLGFRALSVEEVLAFLEDPDRTLPRRCYLLTCDDGFADALRPLQRAAAHHPVLFVPTACAGGPAPFAWGEPLATLDEIAEAARRGLTVGSHARTHRPLPELDDEELGDELRRSREELRAAGAAPVDVLAYPHGRHDRRVRDAARAAGWRAAMGTTPGRNGAGTDRWCLHRLNVHAADGRLALLWKVVTGEIIPPAWERRRRRRAESLARRGQGRPGAPDPAEPDGATPTPPAP